MNAIQLTEEQKNKLLEMCKTLFPEYREICFHHSSYKGMLTGFLKSNDSDIYDNCDLFIHWFELILSAEFAKRFTSYLAKGISTMQEASQKYDGIWDSTTYLHQVIFTHEWLTTNVIDYVYEQYTKQIANK